MFATNGFHSPSSTHPEPTLSALGLSGSSVNEGILTDSGSKLLSMSKGETITSYCPSTGDALGQVKTVSRNDHVCCPLLLLTCSCLQASAEDVSELVKNAHDAYKVWREVPAPKRGEVLRLIREELAANKEALGALISLEMGKVSICIFNREMSPWPRSCLFRSCLKVWAKCRKA